ncbi:hypothetical protein D9757_002833 [Collybiopsis confluens]|uniref:Ribosomal RNA methyltransferase SPB1-like C-terminal domain-containing protein n=1 Tax=Collybiopsis confluens TaxID=2823264 RepID=A0A8H5HVE2_9AGAR|nr:hypothetical protein D9757_002833 [Collybiopsis confluens]
MRKSGGLSKLIGADGVIMEESDGEDGKDPTGDVDEVLDSDEEREKKTRALEEAMDGLYNSYQDRLRGRDAKFKVKEGREKNKEREEWNGVKAHVSSDEEDSERGGWEQMQLIKGNDDSSSDDASEEEHPGITTRKKRRLRDAALSREPKRTRLLTKFEEPVNSGSQASKVWFSQDLFAGIDDEVKGIEDNSGKEDDDDDEPGGEILEEDEDEKSDWDNETQDFETVPQDNVDVDMWDALNEDEGALKQAHIQKHGLTTAEAVTLAQQLVNGEKTKTQLINDGFNRYSLNSKDGLPSWFLDDESKHYKPNIPVTKEAIAALRAKQRALDARPIKKIAEAKARKKFKAAQRLEKAMKKAEGVNSTSDMSEREKASQIEKLMRKGLSKGKPKKEIKLVVAKGANKGVKGRPKGVKGRYTMVDARMRKELRVKKASEKANKKRKRT